MHSQSPRRAPRVATYLRSAQVAAILQVSPKTVARRARAGRLSCRRPLGGHRHSPAVTIHRLAASLLVEVRDR
jgi:predicted site-specific integrase-resolvase